MGPRLVIQLLSYVLWFPLKILGIAALLRVGVRRYPLIFMYSVATLLFAAAELPLAVVPHGTDPRYQYLHWIGEGVTYVLILAVVISLIYRATSKLLPRRIIRLVLVAGGFVFIAVSFLLHYDTKQQHLGDWMTPWTRDLNVCAAILDLALWGLLLRSREKDSTLLLLTGGMGISFAGEAIGTSIRYIAWQKRSLNLYLFGHVVMMLADAAFLYIWWQTFRREANRQDGSPSARDVSYSNR